MTATGGARRAWAWAAATALVTLAPFATVVAGWHTLSCRDTERLFRPVRALVLDALRDGRLPLWNPFLGTGQPLLADGIHGVLHPVSLLVGALGGAGIDALLLAYVVAAALGAHVLARVLGLGPAAAALGGVAYGLSGYVVSMTGFLNLLAGAASLPWEIAGLLVAARGRPLGGVAGGLGLAAALVSGDPPTAALGVAIAAALALEEDGARGLLRLAPAAAAGILLAALQLVPTAAEVGWTTRAVGGDAADRTEWALSPWRLLEWISPGLFFRMGSGETAPVFEWLDGPTRFAMPFASSVFLGVPALALAVEGALRDRRGPVLAATGAFLLWLALGHHAGATQAAAGVPVWGSLRYAEKMMGPVSLVVALLAASGAQAAAEGLRARRMLIVTGALVLASLAALAASAAVRAPPEVAAELGGDPAAALRRNLGRGAVHVLAGALAVSGAVLLARRRAWAAPALLAAAVATSVLLAVPYARHLGPAAAYRERAVLPLEAAAPGPRIATPYVVEVRGGGAIDAWDATLRAIRSVRLPAWNVADHVDEFDSYGAFVSKRFANLSRALGDDRWRQVRRFAVTHVVAQPPASAEQAQRLERATSGGTWLAEEPTVPYAVFAVPHREWATMPPAVRSFARPSEALARLVEDLSDGSDEAVVEAAAPVPAGRGRVVGVHREAERVEIEVDAEEGGLLVVNDAFWPGWRARIDGADAEILAADILVRGVVVPSGRHRVVMAYAPPELRWGAIGSAAGVVAVAALGAMGLARAARRRRGEGAEAAEA